MFLSTLISCSAANKYLRTVSQTVVTYGREHVSSCVSLFIYNSGIGVIFIVAVVISVLSCPFLFVCLFDGLIINQRTGITFLVLAENLSYSHFS